MYPQLQPGDLVVTLRLGRVQPGDIVVVGLRNEQIIKRVVGLRNDQVTVVRDGVYLNGAQVSGPGGYTTNVGRWIVDGDVFVVGDNLGYSVDSREIGPVSIGRVLGRSVMSIRLGSVLSNATRVLRLGWVSVQAWR